MEKMFRYEQTMYCAKQHAFQCRYIVFMTARDKISRKKFAETTLEQEEMKEKLYYRLRFA